MIISSIALAALLIVGAIYFAQRPKNQPSAAQAEFVNLSAQDFKSALEQNPDAVLLDVRTAPEFEEGHIKGAKNIDFYNPLFKMNLDKLDKNKTYFIYCRSGNRSGQAMQIMKELGFKKVYNLQNGIKEWKANSLPLEK